MAKPLVDGNYSLEVIPLGPSVAVPRDMGMDHIFIVYVSNSGQDGTSRNSGPTELLGVFTTITAGVDDILTSCHFHRRVPRYVLGIPGAVCGRYIRNDRNHPSLQ